MGIQFSILGTSFGELSATSGRQAMTCRPGSQADLLTRYHPYGTIGNLLASGGESGCKIVCIVRYVGDSVNAAEAMFEADKAAWKTTSGTIAYAGKNFLRCRLDPGAMVKLSDPLPTNRAAGQAFFDVIAIFTSDDGSS
ncbi:MAG: hypothetical protein KIS92_00830 [Planctomycetota bacterium]|nr:hypothetical protein [Planctomycetota bacterium]